MFGFYFIAWCELCHFHEGLSGKIIFTCCCYYRNILQAYLLTNNTSAHTQRRQMSQDDMFGLTLHGCNVGVTGTKIKRCISVEFGCTCTPCYVREVLK